MDALLQLQPRSSVRPAASYRLRGRAAAANGQPTPPETAATEEIDDAALDRLVAVLRPRPQPMWRRMLAVSSQWPRVSARVLARVAVQARAAAGTDEELALLQFGRLLGSTSDELAICRTRFDEFLDTPSEEWEARRFAAAAACRLPPAIDAVVCVCVTRPCRNNAQALVAARRASLTPAFFEYLQLRLGGLDAALVDEREGAASCHTPRRLKGARDSRRPAALASAGARLLSLVDMHDRAVKDAAQMEDSFKTFQELITGVASVAELDTRVDSMLASGRVDPALVLMATKMYMSVKESPYTSEEVKDVMAHLYWRMKATVAGQQPPAVRILKHLLTMDDPMERRAAMDEAFTPGPELAVGDADMLHTTPDELQTVIAGVLRAYEAQRGRASTQGQAASLMQPAVIERMRQLSKEVKELYS